MQSKNTQSSQKKISEYGYAFIEYLQDTLQNQERNVAIKLEKITEVCIQLEAHHEGRTRIVEKQDYHSHLYEVARLYIDFAGDELSEAGIIIALRHDDREDLDGKTPSKIHVSFENIVEDNGAIVAVGVEMLSKDRVAHIDQTRKKVEKSKVLHERERIKRERDEAYYKNFCSLSAVEQELTEVLMEQEIHIISTELSQYARDIALIRIVDRIHNLRTMPLDSYPYEKRVRKLAQTEAYLLSLVMSIGNPRLYNYFIDSLVLGYKNNIAIQTQQIIHP